MKRSVVLMVAILCGMASAATAQMFGLPVVYSGKAVEPSAVTVSGGAILGTSDSFGNACGLRGSFGVANDLSLMLEGGVYDPNVDNSKIAPALGAWVQYDPAMLDLPFDVYTGGRLGFTSTEARFDVGDPQNLSAIEAIGLANVPLGDPGIFSLYGGLGLLIPTGEMDYNPIIAAGALCDVVRDTVSIYAEADFVDHMYFSGGVSYSF